MENKQRKIIGMILKIPLVLVVILSFFASIYAAYNKILGISYVSSVIFGILIIMYFIGENMLRKKEF